VFWKEKPSEQQCKNLDQKRIGLPLFNCQIQHQRQMKPYYLRSPKETILIKYLSKPNIGGGPKHFLQTLREQRFLPDCVVRIR
jgi:hypothetical protein